MMGWYRDAMETSLKPCYQSLERQASKREELYGRVPPPGDPILWIVDPNPVKNAVPMDAEIRERVRRLSNGKTGGTSVT